MTKIKAILTHNVVNMRAEPNGDSEQVSQGVHGDRVLILDERDDYALIRSYDGYEGWVLRRHVRPALPEEPLALPHDAPDAARIHRIWMPWAHVHTAPRMGKLITRLPMGAYVERLANRWDRKKQRIVRVRLASGEYGYIRSHSLEPNPAHNYSLPWACRFAHEWIGTPYLWGGTTPFGFDCSGLTQRAYRMLHIVLPRDAYLQAQSPLGKTVPEGKPLRAGDLVFFRGPSDPRNRGITHVGLALNNKEFLHAASRDGVIITRFDDPYYSSLYTYRGAWRYHPEKQEP